MGNYIEYHDTIAFHPGYYIKELVDESGLTQEDFAKRLDTTPKNLSMLIRGEQSLSIDIAMKLSRMIGTTVNYWLNLQNAYDALIAEFKSEEELQAERKVFAYFDYQYFRGNFGLPDLQGKKDEQIKALREFFNVATLTVFTKRDMAVSFRSAGRDLSEASIVKANAMVQIAANKALGTDAPRFSKKKFETAVQYALTLTTQHKEFYLLIKKAFWDAGVIMLMVNDRRLNADSFWFTLFHEIGHIMNGDYGISFEKENGEQEAAADRYAEGCLIPPEKYKSFVSNGKFSLQSIKEFANEIERDPGIVLGRLQNDGFVGFDDEAMKPLRHRYIVKISG